MMSYNREFSKFKKKFPKSSFILNRCLFKSIFLRQSTKTGSKTNKGRGQTNWNITNLEAVIDTGVFLTTQLLFVKI